MSKQITIANRPQQNEKQLTKLDLGGKNHDEKMIEIERFFAQNRDLVTLDLF